MSVGLWGLKYHCEQGEDPFRVGSWSSRDVMNLSSSSRLCWGSQGKVETPAILTYPRRKDKPHLRLGPKGQRGPGGNSRYGQLAWVMEGRYKRVTCCPWGIDTSCLPQDAPHFLFLDTKWHCPVWVPQLEDQVPETCQGGLSGEEKSSLVT